MHFLLKITTTLIIIFSLIGCSSTKEMSLENPTWDAERFFVNAKNKRIQGNFKEAIDFFESIEARFPFSEYARQVPLEIAYTYYLMQESDLAISELNRFILNNPKSNNLDYAYYMRGYIYYDKGRTFVDKFLDTPEKKDTKPLREAFFYFKELIEKFPNSKYTIKAGEFFLKIRDILASHELEVAIYYSDREAYVAAINRLNYIIQNYQDTSVMPETLALLEYNYLQSNLKEEAKNTRKILDLNFPNYQMKYKKTVD